jgi:hypothetical protein
MNTARLLRVTQSPSGKGRFAALASCSFAVAPLVLCMAFIWPNDGTKVQMTASPKLPGAQGEILVKQESNGNLSLIVRTEHLAQPGALTPPANVYVVWLQQPNEKPQNVGELQVDKKENGELKTQTAFKHFKIFITAEQRGQADAPQAQTVLSGEVAGG